MTETKSKTKATAKGKLTAHKKANAKEALIVLVTGSREMVNFEYLESILNRYSIGGIVHGDAVGADTLAQVWADDNHVLTARHPVTEEQWTRIGKKAGVLRNQFMLDQHPTISLVIAFPVPGSRGTADMIRRATKAGIDTHIFVGHGCKKS